ncbi:Uncharacterized protein DBV15_02753 [Temnothorax longispinosus]|uniref:Uncharacterized protein n=1 Tax=Temnothorax longispinosus TaxID=300112 RepID=A0A4S2KKY1_9HYME|nr:Uncharacterized protein DBV15_02753 [Temnothorax longispinosus]
MHENNIKQEIYIVPVATTNEESVNLGYCGPDGAYIKKDDTDGLGLCPYDPRHNSTAVFAGKFLLLQ